MLVRETQGDTLVGAIDGVNRTYTTTLPMADWLNVFVNGQLKEAARADGYTRVDANTVLLDVALLPGDTLELEYSTGTGGDGVRTGGGALGGVPQAPGAVTAKPASASSRVLLPSLIVSDKPL